MRQSALQLLVLSLLATPLPVLAQDTAQGPAPVPAHAPSCADKAFGWSDTKPSLNLRHVFCGEYNRSGKPVGGHSMQILASSVDVRSVGVPTALYNGLTVRPVTFSNGETKTFKSFYPDACTVAQVTESALHAAANGKKAGTWMRGPSAPGPAPREGGSKYCLDNAGQPFTIQFAWLGEGRERINTAFPIVPTPAAPGTAAATPPAATPSATPTSR